MAKGAEMDGNEPKKKEKGWRKGGRWERGRGGRSGEKKGEKRNTAKMAKEAEEEKERNKKNIRRMDVAQGCILALRASTLCRER